MSDSLTFHTVVSFRAANFATALAMKNEINANLDDAAGKLDLDHGGDVHPVEDYTVNTFGIENWREAAQTADELRQGYNAFVERCQQPPDDAA